MSDFGLETDPYEDLPDDPEEAFLKLEAHSHLECDRRLKAATQDDRTDIIYVDYIARVLAAISALGLEGEFKSEVQGRLMSHARRPHRQRFRPAKSRRGRHRPRELPAAGETLVFHHPNLRVACLSRKSRTCAAKLMMRPPLAPHQSLQAAPATVTIHQ
jgi:hypothetical protein